MGAFHGADVYVGFAEASLAGLPGVEDYRCMHTLTYRPIGVEDYRCMHTLTYRPTDVSIRLRMHEDYRWCYICVICVLILMYVCFLILLYVS